MRDRRYDRRHPGRAAGCREAFSAPTVAGRSRPPAPEGQGGPQAAAGRRVLKE